MWRLPTADEFRCGGLLATSSAGITSKVAFWSAPQDTHKVPAELLLAFSTAVTVEAENGSSWSENKGALRRVRVVRSKEGGALEWGAEAPRKMDWYEAIGWAMEQNLLDAPACLRDRMLLEESLGTLPSWAESRSDRNLLVQRLIAIREHLEQGVSAPTGPIQERSVAIPTWEPSL